MILLFVYNIRIGGINMIALIILVVIGLLYLIFKKDKEENPANKK